MNNLDKQYTTLLQDILDNGVEKKDRTGTGTLSVFGRQIRHKMSEGFPLLTTKKMYFKGIVTELLWFLRGDTNIKFLVDNDCHIWDGDAYRKYEILMIGNPPEKILSKEEFINKIKEDKQIEHSPFTFAKKWGELGPVYGRQWRSWETMGALSFGTNHYEVKTEQIDQITNLIRDLKTNPDSRRLMVNSWNVGELDSMTLPPCHYGFQVYTRELTIYERADIARVSTKNKQYGFEVEDHWIDGENDFEIKHVLNNLNIPTRAISLQWNQRSVDTFLGLPFNIASYGLLLEIIAKAVNMVPDELIGNLGDTHLYLNHIEQAKEQIGRELTSDERYEYWLENCNPIKGTKDYVKHLKPQNRHGAFNDYKVPKRTREPYPLPALVINDEFWNPDAGVIEQIEHIEISDFDIRDYQSHSTIKAPLSN